MQKLGDIATYINGYAFKPADRGLKGLPIIRIQDLTGNSYDLGFYDGIYPKKIEINNGDILISWSGSLGIFLWNGGKALLNQHIFKVVFDKKDIDKHYFLFAVKEKLNEMSLKTHGATMKHIIKSDFENITISLPDLNEQKRISNMLLKIENLIKMRKNQIQHYDTLTKSLFVEMFGDKAHILTMNDLCNIITDGTHQSPKFVSDGIPFLFVSNVSENKISYDTGKFISIDTYKELYKRTPIEKYDILLSTVGSYGHPAIVKSNKKFLFQRHIAYLKPKKELINSIYLHAAILSDEVQRQIESKVKGIAQKTLNLSEIKTLKIPLPSMTEQNIFATIVEKIDKHKLLIID